MIQAKFGLNWLSGFRGEDFFKSLDGRRMAIAHTGEIKRAITPRWVIRFTSKLQGM